MVRGVQVSCSGLVASLEARYVPVSPARMGGITHAAGTLLFRRALEDYMRKAGMIEADGEKAIELAPQWPKAYLRTARALMSLERGAEAAARLRTALDLAPRDEILLAAYKEAMGLAQCTERTEKAIRASKLRTFNGVGDTDIVGIERGACNKCDCNAYIQKHGRTTVNLMGRGTVRQDNDPSFFLCARCGHDCVSHVDLREIAKTSKSKPRGSSRPGGGEPPHAGHGEREGACSYFLGSFTCFYGALNVFRKF